MTLPLSIQPFGLISSLIIIQDPQSNFLPGAPKVCCGITETSKTERYLYVLSSQEKVGGKNGELQECRRFWEVQPGL